MTDQFIEAALECAKDVLNAVEEAKKIDGYDKWSDQEKITHITKDGACNYFYMRFPIVTRYMICVNAYNERAFKRFLEKGMVKTQRPSPDRVLKLQARYVQYMWEEQQWAAKRTIKNADRRKVYKNAFEILQAETDTFKTEYDRIKNDLSTAQARADVQRARELLDRLSNGEQSLPAERIQQLFESLKGAAAHSPPDELEASASSKLEANDDAPILDEHDAKREA